VRWTGKFIFFAQRRRDAKKFLSRPKQWTGRLIIFLAEAQRKNCKKSSLHPQFPEQLLKSLVLVSKAYTTTPLYHGLEGPKRRQKSTRQAAV
jgi:hypothetical protein